MRFDGVERRKGEGGGNGVVYEEQEANGAEVPGFVRIKSLSLPRSC